MNFAWIVIQNTLQNDAQGHIMNMIKVTLLLVLHLKQMNKTVFAILFYWIAFFFW
jgi:hypothetical protein